MLANQIAVRLPAVMDERADKGSQQAEGIEGLFASMWVNAHPGQQARGQHMQPMELALHPQTRLVCMGDGRGADGLTDGRDGGFQPPSLPAVANRTHRRSSAVRG